MQAVDLPALAPTLTFLGVLGAAALAGWWNSRTKKIETESAPYQAMAERLARVEDRSDALDARVDVLEREKAEDRAYIVQAVPWIAAHVPFQRYDPPIAPAWARVQRLTTPEGHA